MADLCKTTPLPIALDEELIGVFKVEDKERLLQMPQYIILKPSFIGGFRERKNGFHYEKHHGWWITSALEQYWTECHCSMDFYNII
jgi:L-alanine-DL-glutamate epimerase-like enolase superfamily enzyme